MSSGTGEKIPVGISACLLGEEVRYNGGHKFDAYINGTLADYFELIPFCPEVGAGLGVPRPPIRLVRKPEGIRAVGVKNPDNDVTDKLNSYSANSLESITRLYGFILKKGSPSCGMERVKVFNQKGMPDAVGQGLFASALMAAFPHLPMEEEGRLGDPQLRENFIQRVFVYWYWRNKVAGELTVAKITGFHGKMKLTLMSHNQNRARDLGAMVAGVKKNNLEEVADRYITELMQLLKVVATTKNHVNVLQHIQGYLRRELDAADKAELVEVIGQYRKGQLPLIVPITLLKHYFRKCPDPYIDNSWYMMPYPQALKLRNRL